MAGTTGDRQTAGIVQAQTGKRFHASTAPSGRLASLNGRYARPYAPGGALAIIEMMRRDRDPKYR